MQVKYLSNWTYAFFGVVLTILVISNFTNSRHGRACISIREDEIAADAMGINTTYYKVVAFAIGSFFAGLAGAIFAHNFYIIQPTTFGFLKSFDILIYVVLGGFRKSFWFSDCCDFLNIRVYLSRKLPRNAYDYLQFSINYRNALSSNRLDGNERDHAII